MVTLGLIGIEIFPIEVREVARRIKNARQAAMRLQQLLVYLIEPPLPCPAARARVFEARRLPITTGLFFGPVLSK
jgi:hypothetical protein